MKMTSFEVAEFVVGKTIKKISYGSYLYWPMTVYSIEFTDGTRVEFGGNADEARIDKLILPNGTHVEICFET